MKIISLMLMAFLVFSIVVTAVELQPAPQPDLEATKLWWYNTLDKRPRCRLDVFYGDYVSNDLRYFETRRECRRALRQEFRPRWFRFIWRLR